MSSWHRGNRGLCSLLLAAALWGCPSDPEALPPPDLALGEQLYGTYCALCHGADGEGYAADMANSLTSPEFLATATDEFLRHAIVYGRPGTSMSAWGVSRGGPIDEGHEVNSLVAFIRSWQVAETVDVSSVTVTQHTEQADVIYELRCLSCHGEAGAGGPYMSLNNPELHASASDGFLLYAIEHGRSGTPMPAFGEGDNPLTRQQMEDLVIWMRDQALPPHERSGEMPSKDLGDPVLNAGGPEPVWSTEERHVSVHEVHDRLEAGDQMVIIDARPPADYVEGHIAGAVSVPFYAVPEFLDQLPEDVWTLAYCACPHAESGQAADALEAAGRTLVKVLDEGYNEWVDAGYPIREGVEP